MRLSIEISQEQHQFLKAAAAIHGKSIKEYVLESALPNEEEQQAFNQLEELLLRRKTSALNGDISKSNIDAIFDDELSK